MNSSAGSDSDRKQRYEQTQELFLAALEVDRDSRETWVRGQSHFTVDVQSHVLAMIAADDGHDVDRLDAEAAGQPGPTLPIEALNFRGQFSQLPQLKNYEVLEEIAHGGMGVVYKARQLRPNRLVAIKMIRSGVFASTGELERFLTEAEAAAQLDDESVVPVYELGEANGEPFIAMKYIDGENLETLLRQDEPQRADFLEGLLLRVCRAVAGAHVRGIIHRDLKPSNILVDRTTGRPWITDFGLAKYLNKESNATVTGDVLGTPGYMAPEQALGDAAAASTATDVYGLGAILYRFLARQPPIQSNVNLAHAIELMRDHDVVSPRSIDRRVPKSLNSICMKCLEKDPSRRYPNAAELADDLQRFLDGEAVQARPLSWGRRLHRWARHRPGLAITWGSVGILYSYHLLCQVVGWHRDPTFHFAATTVTVLMVAGAWLWQRLLTKTNAAAWVIYVWLTFDVTMVTMLLFAADSANSPLVILYHVLIAASVLRCRARLVGFVTALSTASYCIHLIFLQLADPAAVPPWTTCLPMLLSMFIIGIIQYFSLRRSAASYESQSAMSSSGFSGDRST